MRPEDKNKFAETMSQMSELFDHSVSAGMMELYMDLLDRYTIDEFMRGARYHMRTGKFFPKPVEIIEGIVKSGPRQVAL